MSGSSMRVLASDAVARAAAELIFALQKAFPGVRLIPCEAIESEAIHLEVRLAKGSPVDLAAAQERALTSSTPSKTAMASTSWCVLCQRRRDRCYYSSSMIFRSPIRNL